MLSLFSFSILFFFQSSVALSNGSHKPTKMLESLCVQFTTTSSSRSSVLDKGFTWNAMSTKESAKTTQSSRQSQRRRIALCRIWESWTNRKWHQSSPSESRTRVRCPSFPSRTERWKWKTHWRAQSAASAHAETSKTSSSSLTSRQSLSVSSFD